MAVLIQRIARGLTEVLGAFGAENPRELADEVRGTMALEPFYARQQLQTLSVENLALAQSGEVFWNPTFNAYLIAASMRIVSTAAMTAYAGSIAWRPGVNTGIWVDLAHNNWNTGGLGAGRSLCVCEFVPASPFYIMPGQVIRARLDVLGVDPTAAVNLQLMFGALG